MGADMREQVPLAGGFRAYKVFKVAGNGDCWRVEFYVDGEQFGHGQYQTSEQADDAGVEFMFGGSE